LSTNQAGNSGNIIGGGGGGAGQSTGFLQTLPGGSGADGRVLITYTISLSPTITGLSSNICAGNSITITGTNFIGITAANVKIGGIAVTSITSFTSTQIVAFVASACSGTVTVTTANGTATSGATFTSYSIPSVTATTTFTCVGGTSGTITAAGSGGSAPYTYNLNGGTYQSGNLFTGLAAGTYTLNIKTNTGCTASTSVTVNPYPNSTDDQTATGADTWIGHIYSGMNFNNYIGHFTETETLDEGFGGDNTCFTVTSGATYPSIYTEQFSVRFRMNSSRDGLYTIDLGSDDGSRLFVDGTLLYNNWVDQSFSTRPSVLMNLTGSSSLIYEFYENAINNRVIFNNLKLILANNLSSNTTQSICKGGTGSTISGDVFGTLPSGISLSGTGYQWTYSTTPTGTRTNISGATSATYSPNTSSAPFNVPGIYYIYRNAKLSSTNNTGVSPYVATNESNAATITVSPLSVGGSVGSNSTVCSGTNSGSVNLTGQTGNVLKWQYSVDGGTNWTDIVNTTTSQSFSNLTQTTLGRALVQSGVCTSANSTSVTVTVNPVSVGGTVNSNATVCSGANSGTLNLTGNTGSIARWEYSTNGGSSWTTIANTTTSQTYSNITQTTQYRAVVKSGVCASVNSNPATITVNPAPSASISYSGSPFCSGGATGTVTQTGTTGGNYSSTSGLIINSSTGAINVSSSTPGNYTVTYSIAAGVCTAYSTTTNVSIATPGSWTGAISNDWNDSRNWLCGQIPTSAINVTIPNGASFYPTVTSGLVYANDINIQSGGAITISDGTLQIFGTITNSGIFDASNGTIEMHGTSAQTIPAGAFKDNNIKNLIISNTNSAGVTLGGILDIYQSLTYGTGGTKLNTGGYLSLKSSASETAWIGNMTGHTISGDVTVERYAEAINNWQFLSLATNTTQTIHKSWQENQGAGVVGTSGYGTNITGPTGGIGFDFTSPNASMKYWDNAAGAYQGIMNTGVQFPNKTNGFFVYIRGDRRATASGATPHQPTVLRTKGPLYTGPVNFTIPATSYYSIGNPYASKVDFGNVAGMSAVGSSFYVWDPLIYGSRGAGGYQTLSSATGFKPLIPTDYYNVSTAYPYLESGQAAFVYNASAVPVTLTFKESDKTTGSHLVFRGADISSSEFFRTYLSTSSGKIADGNVVAFNSSYQNRIDAYDAVKISNSGENLGLRRDGIILSIEARSPVTVYDTLYFDLKNVARADYQFRFTPQNMENETLIAFLSDNYLKTETQVSLSENTSVNFSINSDAASYAANRFMIVFRQSSTLPLTFVSIKAAQNDRNVVVDWHVENENNMQQYQVEKSIDGTHFEKVATTAAKNDGSENYQWIDEDATSGYNYYRVRSLSKDNNSLYSTVEKVFVGDLKSTINIYPNPITDGIIHLQFMNQAKGRYSIRLLNHLGQVVMAKKVEFAGGNGSEDINWNYNLNHGIYQLEVSKPDGSIEVIKVLY
jgi:hypothetical protein